MRVFSCLAVISLVGGRSYFTNSLLLGRDGVATINSVFVRRSALTVLGEARSSMFMVSGLYGGTFSLFESPSLAVIDVRIRFGFGVGSGVWSCWSHDAMAVDAMLSCCR